MMYVFKRKNDRKRSDHRWQLKDKQEDFTITWRIVAKVKATQTSPSDVVYALLRNTL